MPTPTIQLSEIRFVPDKLREARGDKPAAEIARVLNVSRQRYYAYETGQDKPPPDMIVRMCLFFEKPIEFFSNADEESTKKFEPDVT